MKYLCALKNLLLSLVASTIIIYAINIIAGTGRSMGVTVES